MPKKLKVVCPHCKSSTKKWKKDLSFMMTCNYCKKSFATDCPPRSRTVETFKSAAKTPRGNGNYGGGGSWVTTGQMLTDLEKRP